MLQDKALNEYFDTKWKAWCEMCEKQLKKNGNGWLAGDKVIQFARLSLRLLFHVERDHVKMCLQMSWGDLFTAEWADRESRLKAGALDDYPLLKVAC